MGDGVGTSKPDVDGVVQGGAGCEGSVIREVYVNGSNPIADGGICQDCGKAGDQCVGESGVGRGGSLTRSLQRSSPGRTLIQTWVWTPRKRCAFLSSPRRPATLRWCGRLHCTHKRAGFLGRVGSGGRALHSVREVKANTVLSECSLDVGFGRVRLGPLFERGGRNRVSRSGLFSLILLGWLRGRGGHVCSRGRCTGCDGGGGWRAACLCSAQRESRVYRV